MKTSELKKWLDENEWGYIEKEDFINVEDIKIYKKIGMLGIPNGLTFGVGSDTSMMLQKAIEYLETPIYEREDEKLYEFKSTCSYRYDWGEERLDLYLIKERSLYVFRNGKRQYFTQSEIDNFPQEIKGAIECGFLRKVEVE